MSATDKQNKHSPTLESPGRRAAAVTPSDSTDMTYVSRAVYVGTGGDVKVITAGGDTVTFKNAPSGSYIIARVARVLATGTTALDIVSLGDW